MKIARGYQLYLLLLLPMTYIIVFSYIPMYGAQIAFKDFQASLGIWGSPWVGLQHFNRFFSSYNFRQIVRNVIGINLYSLAVGFPAPIILALLINNIDSGKFRRTVQTITYAPHFISTTVMVGILIQFLSARIGIINKMITSLGFESVSFMGEASLFKTIYVLSDVWQHAGWGAIIYIAALAGIDVALHEAAVVDGATKFQRTLYIDIPGILPTALILLILSMGSIMNVGFEKVFLMQNPLNVSTSEVINTYIYKVGIASQMPNYSFSTAIGLFNSGINFILLVMVNQIVKKTTETSLW